MSILKNKKSQTLFFIDILDKINILDIIYLLTIWFMSTKIEEQQLMKELQKILWDYIGLSVIEIEKIIQDKKLILKKECIDIEIKNMLKYFTDNIVEKEFIINNNSMYSVLSWLTNKIVLSENVSNIIKEIYMLQKYISYMEVELKTVDWRVNKLKKLIDTLDNENIIELSVYSEIYRPITKEVEKVLEEKISNIKNKNESKKPLLKRNTNFREYSDDLDKYTFESKVNPLIIIKEEWEKGYYKTSSEKMKVIPTIDFDKDLILFIRWWQWSSDVFELNKKDFIKMWYNV